MARQEKLKKASQRMEHQKDPAIPEAKQNPTPFNSNCILEEEPEILSASTYQGAQSSHKEASKEDIFLKELKSFIFKHNLSDQCIDELLELLQAISCCKR